jgi:hypothetical protein
VLRNSETVCVVRPDVSLADTMHFVSHVDAARTNCASRNHELEAPNIERTLQRYAAGQVVPMLPAFVIGEEKDHKSTKQDDEGSDRRRGVQHPNA